MAQHETESREQWLLDGALILLVSYNFLFITDVVAGALGGLDWAHAAMGFINDRRGWVTLFEAIAAVSLFVDLVVRFDAYPARSRTVRVAAIGLAMAGLVFKAFTFYLDSAYLE